MQQLKVFISSTCYDKGPQRDALKALIENLGHEAILSDQGGVFYDPREHSHTACVKRVKDADLVILMIGDRFGGEAQSEALDLVNFDNVNILSQDQRLMQEGNRISITQAETLYAFQENISVFTFVDKNTWDNKYKFEIAIGKGKPPDEVLDVLITHDHDTNKVKSIFNFINYIRKRPNNNGIEILNGSGVTELKQHVKSGLSALFKNALKSYMNATEVPEASISLKNRIVEGNREYLELLAQLISESEKEVFFTSTHMASTKDENPVYREGQTKIIEASRNFKSRNSERLHFGIIDRTPDTSGGAAELRRAIPDISLRFRSQLNTRHASFFISDGKKVVLRMNLDKDEGIKYALLIENDDFARILKQYFFSIWDTSELMKTRFESVLPEDDHTNMILDISGIESKADLERFVEKLHEIDELTLLQPSDNKIIKAQVSKFGGHLSDRASDIYEDFIVNNINYENLKRQNIAEIKSKISRNSSIDYNKHSDSFFFQFFLANYFKTRHALQSLDSLSSLTENLSIMDIGGGGGSSSLAVADHFQSNGLNDFKLTVLDRSLKQLKVTESILSERDLNIEFVERDAYEFLQSEGDDKYDLIVASNFMCEANSQHPGLSLPKLLKGKLETDGFLVVVERLESEIYEEIESLDLYTCRDFFRQNIRYTIPKRNQVILDALDSEVGYELSSFLKTSYSVRYGIYK